MGALRPALTTLRWTVAPWARRPRYPCFHTCAARGATPLPLPSMPGPPPETPVAQPSAAAERVARKRKQADLMKQARAARDAYTGSSKPKSVLSQRFWKEVIVHEGGGGLQILLDARPVRLPNRQVLTIPPSKHQLATAIALEWDHILSAQQALKTDYVPVTTLIARAIDIEDADAEGRDGVRKDIVRYLMRVLSTDTLLCWAPGSVANEAPRDGKTLRQLQQQASLDIIAYLTANIWPGIEIRPILQPDSIIPVSQDEATTHMIRAWCSGLPAYELAGLERAVLASKSLLVGVRLIYEWGEAFAQSRAAADASTSRFGIDEAAKASSLEVTWQTGQWGEVEDTHDVEKEDLRRQLGSAVLLVGGDGS